MNEQNKQKYENPMTVKQLHRILSKMVEDGGGDAQVFTKDPESNRTFIAVYGWGSNYYPKHNHMNFYLILCNDKYEWKEE